MAINKTINKSTKTHAAMRNCIEYVLQEHKTDPALVYVTGPALEEITYDSVYKSFLDEKKIWEKDSGRMYAHNIISWHKDEHISLQEALIFGKTFAEKWFQGFQTLIGVHKDRNHVDVHLVTNTVSFEDGHKLHNSRADLERMKQFTNEMCRQRGLTVAEKGKDFYGNELEEGHVMAWSKDKYHLLVNEAKESHVAACAIACMEVMEDCTSKEEFIAKMERKGWKVTWKDSRKNITFENVDGKKVRDTNISKTFHMNITKEALINEFERQNQIRSNRNQKKNSSNITETSSQLLEEMAQAVQLVTAERDDLLRQLLQNQRLFRKQRKEWEEKIQEKDFEMELSRERNNRLESDLRYTKKLLDRENMTSNWQTRRIRELEEEVAKLKNRTLWQQIWADIKPKRKGNCYGRRNKWKEFGKKVLDVVLAVGYAVAVCWLVKVII